MAASSEERERGAVLILSAIIMMIILMIAAFATDLGAWYRQGQQQQRSADLASLNGINAYDDTVKAYFASKGVSDWSGLSATDQGLAEQQGMQAAYDSIVAVLKAAGTPVSSTPVMSISPPPGESTISVTADDGSEITIRRTINSEITVTIRQPGNQYFSQIIRSAPEIERSATAIVSNCGAICNIPIVLNPPFSGFSAVGKGDGFGPLVFGDEVWAVNHHVRSTAEGEIICMNRLTKSFCSPTGQFSLGPYNTGNRPVEHIDVGRGKIYFTVRNSTTDRSGLACFDVVARTWCSTQFTPLWDQTSNDFPATVNATGPWAYNNRLYVMNQVGTLACVNPDTMATCGSWNTAAFGHGAMPSLLGTPRLINGERNGSKIYFTHYVPTGVVFHCWDVAANAACATWSTASLNPALTGRDDQRMTFFKYDATTHQPNGICVMSLEINTHGCYNLSGGGPITIPGLNTHLAPLDNTWAGDTYTWEGKRTFFAGGNSNNSACWNWETSSQCGLYDHFADQPAATHPYAFAEVGNDCIIGLGHESTFFTFHPVGMTSCVDTSTSTTINPCTCTEGSGNRWGILEIPADLLAQVDAMVATVTEPDGTLVLDHVDLLANGGQLDLTDADQTAPYLNLVLEVQSKLKPDGTPLWTNPYNADLELIVQPTLSD